MLDPSSVEVNVSWEDDNSPGNVVQVQASHTFQPLIGSFMLPDIELSSTARMVVTQ